MNPLNWALLFLAVAVVTSLVAFPMFKGLFAWLAGISFGFFLFLTVVNLFSDREGRAREP